MSLPKHEETAYALLRWYINASDQELRDLNVTREDVLRLSRYHDGEFDQDREDELYALGRMALISYRLGQLDGPPSPKVAAVK